MENFSMKELLVSIYPDNTGALHGPALFENTTLLQATVKCTQPSKARPFAPVLMDTSVVKPPQNQNRFVQKEQNPAIPPILAAQKDSEGNDAGLPEELPGPCLSPSEAAFLRLKRSIADLQNKQRPVC